MKAAATRRLVLDASVTLAWCFPDEKTAYAEAVLDLLANGAEGVAPAIWPFEVANALLAGEKRQRVTVAQVTSLLRRIADLPISLDPAQIDHIFQQVLPLARQMQLSEYDAAYLELAMRQGLPLASLDVRLQRAAKAAGIAVFRI
jgi:predicted nucleic acid-binding protein